jgi:hypothetical protein
VRLERVTCCGCNREKPSSTVSALSLRWLQQLSQMVALDLDLKAIMDWSWDPNTTCVCLLSGGTSKGSGDLEHRRTAWYPLSTPRGRPIHHAAEGFTSSESAQQLCR